LYKSLTKAYAEEGVYPVYEGYLEVYMHTLENV